MLRTVRSVSALHGATFLAAAILVAASLMAPLSADAQDSFTEDFTTTAYQDSTATTANWDTNSGSFGLPPFAPFERGAIDPPGGNFGGDVVGNLVAMATGNSLTIIDATDPDLPVVSGSVDVGVEIFRLAVSGDLVVTACSTNGLRTVDISDPTAPVLVGALALPGFANMVVIAGDRAYVGVGPAGFCVVDIANPAAPVLVTTVPTASNPYGIAVDGDLLAVSTGLTGLFFFDVSNPAVPVAAGTYAPGDQFNGLSLAGDQVVVAVIPSRLIVLDVTNPAAAVEVGSASHGFLGGYEVSVDGNLVMMPTGYGGWAFFDIGEPTAPVYTGNFSFASNSAFAGLLIGDLAYLFDSPTGLHVVQARQRVPATAVGSGTGGGDPRDVAVAGDRAYLADSDGLLRVMDISDPTAPVALGSCSTAPWDPMTVTVAGDHAYVGTAGPLYVIDVSDPAAPTVAGTMATPSGARDVDVSGDLACVAGMFEGVHMVDIANPALPAIIGTLDRPTGVVTVALRGDVAYIGGGDGLEAVDVSDPTNPTLLGAYPDQYTVTDLEVAGDLAFVRDSFYDLRIYDITTPGLPTLVATHDLPGGMLGVEVAGKTAAVFDQFYGCWFLDLTDPTQPLDLGLYQTSISTKATCLEIVGDLVYMWDYFGRVDVVQIYQADYDATANVAQSLSLAQPANLITRVLVDADEVGDIAWEISATGGSHWQDVAADSSWTDLAEPGQDLRWRSTQAWSPEAPQVTNLVIAWETSTASGVADTQARRLVLHRNAPNPFNPQTRMSYEIPTAGHVRLEVHDLRGQRVATLIDGVVAAGVHQVTWNGRDAGGRPVAAGVYLSSLRHGGETLTGRMTLVK